MHRLLCGLIILVSLNAGEYKRVKEYRLPGDGGWDYLNADADARRLYVSHATQTQVLNLDTGELLGSVPGKGVHGVALVPQSHRGYITNGTANNLTVFDTTTLKLVGEIGTGKKPDAILYDPFTKHVFVSNNGGGSMTVVDPATGKVSATVELGGAPETSVSDGKGMIYTNLEDTNEIVKIEAKSPKVVARWKLTPCETPTGLAFDAQNQRLFVGCRSRHFAVVDVASGKVTFNAPIGTGVDAVAFDTRSRRIYLSNGDGTVNVFHQDAPDKYSTVETVTTVPGAKTLTLDSKTGLVWLSAADYEPLAAGQKGRTVRAGSFRVFALGK